MLLRLPWEIWEKNLRFSVSSVRCQATCLHQQQRWHSLAQHGVEEELTPFRKVVDTAEKHTKSLPGMSALFSAHRDPAVSGGHETESGRLGAKFRLFSELEQDPHTEPKVTAPLACLPKIHFLEPKAIH